MDAVLTTNPQRSRDVSSAVDVPYGEAEVFEANGHRFGPHLKPFEKWLGSLAIINNVRCHTVSHLSGRVQISRLGTGTNLDQPAFVELVGGQVDSTPLRAVAMGAGPAHSTGTLECIGGRFEPAPDLCDAMGDLSPEDLLHGAEGLEQLHRNAGNSPGAARQSARLARYMRSLATAPKFEVEKWGDETDPAQRMVWGGPQIGPTEKYLQRTLWFMENDLASSFSYTVQAMEWDSHFRNLEWQTKNSAAFFPLLARFFDELHTRKNAHGTLADNTVVALMSELGRNPYLNADHGKDHLPEMPVMLFGSRFAPGVYGASGRELEAVPIDLATGHRARNGGFVELDDISATLLSSFDVDPFDVGYTGRVLPFLRKA